MTCIWQCTVQSKILTICRDIDYKVGSSCRTAATLLLIQNTPSQQVCLKLAVSVACGSSPRAVDWWAAAQDRLG